MKRKNISNFEKYVVYQINEKFNFLKKNYDFKVEKEVFDTTHTSVYYKNKMTAVCVSLDQRMGGIYVDIIRLINQLIPEEPINYSQEKHINHFDIGNILDIRAPEFCIERPNIEDLLCNHGREKVISRVLKQNANALRTYSQDVLKGDFSILDKIEGNIKRNLKKDS